MASIPPLSARPVPPAQNQQASAEHTKDKVPAAAAAAPASAASAAYVPQTAEVRKLDAAKAAEAAQAATKPAEVAVQAPKADGSVEGAKAAEAAKAAPTPAAGRSAEVREAETPSSAQPQGPAFTSYPVQKGDSLWKIATALKANNPGLAHATIQEVINTIIVDNPQIIGDGPKRKKDGGMIFAGEPLKIRTGAAAPAAAAKGPSAAAAATPLTAQQVNDQLIAAMAKAPAAVVSATERLAAIEEAGVDTSALKAAMTVAEQKCDAADAELKTLIVDLKAGKYKAGDEPAVKTVAETVNRLMPQIRDGENALKILTPELEKLGLKSQKSSEEAQQQAALEQFDGITKRSDYPADLRAKFASAYEAHKKGDSTSLSKLMGELRADPRHLAVMSKVVKAEQDRTRPLYIELVKRAAGRPDASAELKAASTQLAGFMSAKKVSDADTLIDTTLNTPANKKALDAAAAELEAAAPKS